MTRSNGGKRNSARDGLWNGSRKSVRNLIWRDGAMTDADGPFDTLAEHLRTHSASPAAKRLRERLGQSGIPLDDSLGLWAVLAPHAMNATRRKVLVECLALWAPRDEVAALALVHLLRPELEIVAARLSRLAHLDPYEAEGSVLGAAWEALTRRPPPLGCERLQAIWSTLRRSSGLRRLAVEPVPEGFDREAPEESSAQERWPGLLDAAVSAGVLSCTEALLIVRTRVDGEPLRCVAADLGRPYDALRMERRRAEAALRAYVSSSGASS